jgi:Leucine-rich repeat (LRR) protein
MIIYNNYIIITPNKCGSHSLDSFFQKFLDTKEFYVRFSANTDFPDNPIYEKLQHSVIIPENASHLKRVMLVRNPYERLASILFGLKDIIDNEERIINDEESIIDMIKNQRENHRIVSKNFSERYENHLGFYEGAEDTPEFLENIKKISSIDGLSFNDKIIVSWWRTLGEYADILDPEYIIHIENPIEDLKKIEVPDIHLNKFPHEFKTELKKGKNFKDIINTQRIIDTANEYFNCAKDAVRFGYKPIYKIEDL